MPKFTFALFDVKWTEITYQGGYQMYTRKINGLWVNKHASFIIIVTCKKMQLTNKCYVM